ncbi:MAG: glycosyltransferase family 2 protein [Blastocatellia bacterium]
MTPVPDPTAPGSPLVHVVVLNYQMREPTLDCLRSLQDLTYPNWRLVVVDNGSDDGLEEVVQRDYPAAVFLQTGENLGYTGGNNRGLAYALAEGADYTLILNPDTVLANPELLSDLVTYLEAHPEVGIAGPRVFLRDRQTVQNTVLFAPSLWRSLGHWGRYRLAPDSLVLSGSSVVEAEVLNGVCVLLRSRCLYEIGLFDEVFFMYIEDADLDERARRAGWSIRYLPINGVIHRQKREGYHPTSPVAFLLKRNSIYYLVKTGQRSQALGYALCSLLLMGGTGLWRALWHRDRSGAREAWRFCQELSRTTRVILKTGYPPAWVRNAGNR